MQGYKFWQHKGRAFMSLTMLSSIIFFIFIPCFLYYVIQADWELIRLMIIVFSIVYITDVVFIIFYFGKVQGFFNRVIIDDRTVSLRKYGKEVKTIYLKEIKSIGLWNNLICISDEEVTPPVAKINYYGLKNGKDPTSQFLCNKNLIWILFDKKAAAAIRDVYKGEIKNFNNVSTTKKEL